MEKNLKTQKRHAKRGQYTRERKKKFDFLKHTNRLGLYYLAKNLAKRKKEIKTIKIEPQKISFWDKLLNYFKRLWQSKSMA